MLLVIMRHGEAESYDPRGDLHRELTARGKKDVRLARVWLEEKLVEMGIKRLEHLSLIHSPYTRAKETAETFSQGLEALFSESSSIVPESMPGRALDCTRLFDFSSDKTIPVIVTHQPLISRLMAYLANGAQSLVPSITGEFSMLPGSIAILSADHIERGCCELIDVFHPFEAYPH